MIQPELTPDLQRALTRFINRTPGRKVDKNLRTMFLKFLLHRHEYLPLDFSAWIDDFDSLFDLLDHIPPAPNK